MRLVRYAGLAAAATLALAACGSSGHNASKGHSASVVPPSHRPMPGPPIGPGNLLVLRTVRLGQPFTQSYQENNTPAQWRITLDRITCGDPGIFDRHVLAMSDTSTGEPLTIPQPGKSMQFCLVKFAVTNLGDSNQPWMATDATVNVGMAAYQDDGNGPGYDAEQAYMQEAQPASQTSDFGINPGVSAESWSVYEIPVTAHPTSVSVPLLGASGQEVVITLPRS